ncbi:MAG: geranylgeranylglycerol-phosphate geranylgeranyltransferase [Chitinophagaceae bacterium]
MQLITSFFRLIRWQNLLFIILTQALFYFCIYSTIYNSADSIKGLLWLMFGSALIAAAGYIINDYFDLNIDQVNKPNKNVINSFIGRRWAIVWHLTLSITGIVATAFAVGSQKWYLIAANAGCVLLLWLYSTSLKRQVLIGNIIISVLTAWTILVLFFLKVPVGFALKGSDESTIKFLRITFLYAGFAFIISLIREAVKDIEDMQGDARYGCKTLPIVAGVVATKIYIAVWIVVLVAALFSLQLYVVRFGWWWAVVYSFLFLIVPLVFLLAKLYTATQKLQFSYLSSIAKGIMLTGILSMCFFKLYF